MENQERVQLLQFVTGPSIPASTFNAEETIHQGARGRSRLALTSRGQTGAELRVEPGSTDGERIHER